MRRITMVVLMVSGFPNLGAVPLTALAGWREQTSLKGLDGVETLIEQLEPNVIADGLNENSIRTAVELTLRSNGIRR